MKKRRQLLALLGLVMSFNLLFAGCSANAEYPTDEAYHFDTDAQYMLFPTATERVFAESEDGYYFNLLINGQVFLFFADKDTMQPVPLCSRPNCLHYAETDEERRSLCTANIPGLMASASIFYYNGALYVPEYNGPDEIVIMQYTPDGSSKKQLFSLGEEAAMGNSMVFHRGFFYVAVTSLDEEQNAVSRIWKYSVDNPGRKRECIFQTASKGGFLQDLQAIGNHLYFLVMADGVLHFYTLGLGSGRAEPFFDTGGRDGNPQQITRFQDKLLFNVIHPEPDKVLYEQNATMYMADQDGGNLQIWRDAPWALFAADGQYVYEYDIPVAEDPSIRIFDAEGSLLVDYSLAEHGIKCRDLYVGAGEYVFLYASNFNKVYYFHKSEIATGKISPKLLLESPNSY